MVLSLGRFFSINELNFLIFLQIKYVFTRNVTLEVILEGVNRMVFRNSGGTGKGVLPEAG